MRITDHLQTLLYRYECVVVPEFGAFICQRRPAYIDKETQAFFPPSKTLSFNRQLKENDGVLANFIAKAEGISYEQSLQKIYSFVENLTETLENHDQINLEKIGLFYRRGDKFLFQPEGTNNYLREAFGTSAVTTLQINRQTVAAQVEETPEIAFYPEVVEQESLPERKTGTNFWRYAAVGILAIGLGGLLTANIYSDQIKSHNIAAQQEAEQEIETLLQQATFSIEDPLPAITFKVKAKRGKYHLVAGAFRNQENAHKKLDELKKEGYQAKYIGKNKFGLHQVIYDSYENRQDALKELRQLHQEDSKSGAWLLVMEL